MRLFSLSRGELATYLGDWLAAALGSPVASRPPPGFYSLPGQDPFAHNTPQAALADLYWASTRPRRFKLSRALLDLASRTECLLPVGVLELLVRTCGAIRDPDLLMPLIQTLGARGDLGKESMPVYSTLISVAAGFGPCEQSWDAAREIAGLKYCPEKLVFDIFDLGMADRREPWHQWFRSLEPSMLRACGVQRVSAVRVRLRYTAERLVDSLSTGRIEAGLRALVGDQALLWPESEWLDSSDPLDMLVAALIAGPKRHFQVLNDDAQVRIRRHLPLSLSETPEAPGSDRPNALNETATPMTGKPLAPAFSRLGEEDTQEI